MRNQNAKVGLNKPHLLACLRLAEYAIHAASEIEKSLKSKDPFVVESTVRELFISLHLMAIEFENSGLKSVVVSQGVRSIVLPVQGAKITAAFSGRKAC